MLKKIILLIVLAFFVKTTVKAQEKNIDTTTLICKYNYKYIVDTARKKGGKDTIIMEIGKNVCKQYSQRNARVDSLYKVVEANPNLTVKDVFKTNVITSNIAYKNYNTTFVVYFNYPKGNVTISDIFAGKKYKYKENIEKIQWTLIDGYREHLTYKCKRARCLFRGREWEAWYTTDIPATQGPYIFSGLPGLILKLTDIQYRHFQYECIEIKVANKNITENTNSFMSVSKKDFFKMKERLAKRPNIFADDLFDAKDANGNPLPPPKINVYYNPIELDE